MERSLSRFRPNLALAALVVGAVVPHALQAQVETNIPVDPTSYDTTFFAGLEWQNVGPNRGGRSVAVAGSDARPLEYYFGATGGGLWKTTDGGTTWRPVTDGQIGSASIGGVAVCPANPDVVYIGTGETQLRGNILRGDGVYRSTDAGETWTHIGLEEARNFARVRVHPTDCNTVYAAAFGHYGHENEERGLYKSTDGGATWRRVLYRNAETGAVDISIHPDNPDLIYAALWEAWRKPWGMSSGGPGSGLFRSTDGGESWTEITHNPGLIPDGMLVGKIGVSVSPADQNRVYAIIEADSGGVFRSDDGGVTWTRTNDERKLRQRAFYYTRINADTQDPDRVYVLNVGFFRSDDAGETFETTIRVPHGDNHDLWIAPSDNQRMMEGNDGGGNVTFNGGRTWTEQDYPTAQIYRLTVTNHDPYFLCGGQQDNSTICVPAKGWGHLLAGGVNAAGPSGDYGYSVGGCESGYVAHDPRREDIYYAGCYGGALERYDHSTGQTRAINVWPENPMGQSAEDLRERVQWTFPIVFDPQDDVLYTTSQHVWRTTNEGQTWERISPDLTRADPATLGPSGGPITKDQTGVETYATVFALAPSRLEPDVIWAGSDDGLVHVTRDNGATWENITPPDAPEFLKITTVEDSPHRPGTAFVVGHRNLLGDHAPYVYRTTDYGRSWTSITGGLPADEIARSIREDLVRPGLLFLGTERGVWVSFDDGLSWQSLQRNLPTTQVADLAVAGQDLAIATHGRSFWVMPSIAFLRQMSPAVSAREFHLFRPGPAIRGVDDGVAVDYYLRRPVSEVTVEFLDAQGNVIQTFTGEAADTVPEEGEEDDDWRGRSQRDPSVKAGMNRFTWNLRYPGYVDFPGMIFWAARNAGPMAVPGTYRVRVTAGGETQTETFEVRLDPRIEGVTIADLQRRFDLAIQIRDEVTRANEAVLLIRGVNQQIDSVLARTEDPGIEQAGLALRTRLAEIEEEIYQVRNQSNQDPLNYPIRLNNKLAALLGHVESAEAPPTDASYEALRYLTAELEQRLTALEQALDSGLPPLNQRLRDAGLDEITRTPLAVDEDEEDGEEEVEPEKW